jgi:hypothetical protein
MLPDVNLISIKGRCATLCFQILFAGTTFSPACGLSDYLTRAKEKEKRKRKTMQAVRTTPTLIKEKEPLCYRVP